MKGPVGNGRFTDKALLVYLASGLIVGTCLAILLERPALQSVWYEQHRFPIMPTCPYWAAHGLGLLLATVMGAMLSTRFGILAPSWASKARGLAGAAIIGGAIPFVGCPLTSLSMRQWGEEAQSPVYVVAAPLLVAFLISLGLRIATQQWYMALACALLVAGVLALVVGNLLSNALGLGHANSMIALVSETLWALLSGFWIRAADRDKAVLEKATESSL